MIVAALAALAALVPVPATRALPDDDAPEPWGRPVADARAPEARGHASRSRATCATRRRPGGLTPAYRRMRARWHARAPRGLLRAWMAEEVRPLVLRPAHRREKFTLYPDPVTGRFDEAQLAIAREAFRYHEDDATVDVHPRVLEIAYRAVLRFEVPYVTLVSGYRTTRATSRHNQGRAMDVVFPGVSDRGLAAFLRRQGFVGVGVYPVSGFVHLDVRERSYFWTDASAPGRRPRVRGVARAEARRFDRDALRRGEQAVPDLPELLAGEGEGEIVDEAAAEGAAPDGEGAGSEGAAAASASDA